MALTNIEYPAAYSSRLLSDRMDEAYPADNEELHVEVADNDCILGSDIVNDSKDERSSEEN